MNVLLIPEDFRKDQFILQPIIEAMFTKLGKPAIVEVLKDPLIRGIDQALKIERRCPSPRKALGKMAQRTSDPLLRRGF
jgi:hypothetical protein